MKLDDVDGFSFDFTDAINAFVFDNKDKASPYFHGMPMKAVDILAEFVDSYLFVEIKNFDDPATYQEAALDGEALQDSGAKFRWLKTYLKYKYRDSFLFRYAEGKIDKPIDYICLLNFDNALTPFKAKEHPIAFLCKPLNFIVIFDLEARRSLIDKGVTIEFEKSLCANCL